MSRGSLTAVNPKICDFPSARGNDLVARLAEDSKTWVVGELGFYTSGTATPVSTTLGSTNAAFQFCDTQSTTTSTSTVNVRELNIGDRLEMYVVNDGNSATIGAGEINSTYGVYGASNVTYLDLKEGTGPFRVKKIASNYEPERNAVTDSPGKCIVEYVGDNQD